MNRPERIKRLVELLQQQEIAWDDVEDLLEEFPGWLALVRGLRYPVRPMDNRISWGPVPLEFTQVRETERVRLLEFFQPLSILAVSDLTAAERARALVDCGVDPKVFCTEHRMDAIPEISVSAEEVLNALKADKTLLRGHAGAIPADQLIMPAGSPPAKGWELLRPGEAEPLIKSGRLGWLRWITGKK